MAFLKRLQKQQDDSYPHDKDTKHTDSHDESNWLVSYADMMTLLCGFFIMLFSMATLSKEQYEKITKEVSEHFSKQTAQQKLQNKSKSDLAEELSLVFEQQGLKTKVIVSQDQSGAVVTFQSSLFFDTLSSDLKIEGQNVLVSLMQAVKDKQTQLKKRYRVVVEGHTDGRPVTSGPYPSNWELSGSRAARVVRLFLEQGFDAKQLLAIGYADTRPIVVERGALGELNQQLLSRNRRVVIRIMDPDVTSLDLTSTDQGGKNLPIENEPQITQP